MEFSVCPAAVAVAELDKSGPLINLIRNIVSDGDGDFEWKYEAPIRDLAWYIQMLPASPEHHTYPGGLLRHAVTSAYYALRLADGYIFGGALPAEVRRVVERESRYAAFLVALVSPITLPHRYLNVTSPDGEAWSETSIPAPLGEWASQRGQAYRIEWRQSPSLHVRPLAAWIGGNVLAPYWEAMSRIVVLDAMAAIAPEERSQGQESPLQRIVRDALGKSIETARSIAAQKFVPTSGEYPSTEQITAAVPQTKSSGLVASSPPVTGDNNGSETVGDGPKPLTQAELELPDGGAGMDPQVSLPQAIKELLSTLADDIRKKPQIAKNVKWTDEYLTVAIQTLGQYGLPAPTVTAALKKAGLAEDGNGRTLKLVKALGVSLLPFPSADTE